MEQTTFYQNSTPINKRMLSIHEASAYLGVGRNSAYKFLESIGAKQRIGRRVLYDKSVIDQYFDKQKEGENHD